MKVSQASDAKPKTTKESPVDRLATVVDQLWASHGRAQISARLTASLADAPPSLINYYFGSFEHLLINSLSRQFERWQDWSQQKSDALHDLPAMGPEASGHFLACLIDDLCVLERPMVFAWFECQILAARDPAFYEIATIWQAGWRDFWQETGRRLGMGDAAELMPPFADGELAFHRIRSKPPLDRACLSETCVAWMRLVSTGQAGPMPIRDHLRAQAEQTSGGGSIKGTTGFDIASAAARLVAQQGAGAVTHRAVAAAAGVNLGAVTYHFPTSGDLMHAAFEAIYAQMTRTETVPQPAPQPASGAGDFADKQAGYMASPGGQDNLLALDEFIAAAARDPALTAFGGALRYTRGRTLSRGHIGLYPRSGASVRSEAALLSAFGLGLGRYGRLMPEAGRQERLHQLSLKMTGCLR